MKILVISQNFFPEQFRITNICEELVAQGNSVTVITGKPCYGFPNGEIPREYRKGRNFENINGLKVYRVNHRARKQGGINRILHYYSFVIKSKRLIRKLDDDFDVIFVNQLSPVLQTECAIKYKKKYGTKVVLYCLDLWPESLVAGGFKRDSFIFKHYHKVSKRIYKSVDTILVTSKAFVEYFNKEFGILDTKYLPQYAEGLFLPECCQKQENGEIGLLFAGNIGNAQSVETLIKATALCRDVKNLKVHIVGDGIKLQDCRNLANELKLDNVIFYGRKPLEDMPKYYSMADAMVVTLTDDVFSNYTMPGKVQTYMASRKPIICCANGETAEIIKEAECGYVAEAGNEQALAKRIQEFVLCKDREKLAKNSYDYYNEHFTKEKFFEKLQFFIEI